MADTSDPLLLRFTRDRSNEAFRALVIEHSPIVYGTALRRLNGDRAAAEDVTQEVFLLLAKKAPSLTGIFLSGWLHRQACRRAANHIRTEKRRRHREQIANELTAENTGSPFLHRELDEALLILSSADREALLLRFFEEKDYRAVGQSLGTTEDAARKRVRRALDRLASVLKSRGIALTGASLEADLLGIGQTPTPDLLVAKISALSPSTTSPLLLMLKPLASGVLAASLVAGATLAIRRNSSSAETAAPSPPDRPQQQENSRFLDPLPDPSALESVINDIKRSNVGLADSLTRTRLEVILDRITLEQIPEFIVLAADRLTGPEAAATYEPLFKRWMAADPDAAITFALENDSGRKVNEFTQTNLLNNLFRGWLDKDPVSTRDWLVRHIDHPNLQKADLRDKLMRNAVTPLFNNGKTEALFAFIDRLPSTADRLAALGAVTGKDNHNGGWERAGIAQWIAFHTALQNQPDAALRDQATLLFWKNAAIHQSGKLAKLDTHEDPAIRLYAALGRIAADVRPIEKRDEDKNRVSISYEKITDRTEAEAAALATGTAAGLSSAETLRHIGQALATTLDYGEFTDWQRTHPSSDFDDIILARARTELAKPDGQVNHPNSLIALEWSSLIADPALRARTTRAAFIRLLSVRPDIAATVPDRTDLPADVLAGLQFLLDSRP